MITGQVPVTLDMWHAKTQEKKGPKKHARISIVVVAELGGMIGPSLSSHFCGLDKLLVGAVTLTATFWTSRVQQLAAI